jgi:hypothetical protein
VLEGQSVGVRRKKSVVEQRMTTGGQHNGRGISEAGGSAGLERGQSHFTEVGVNEGSFSYREGVRYVEKRNRSRGSYLRCASRCHIQASA